MGNNGQEGRAPTRIDIPEFDGEPREPIPLAGRLPRSKTLATLVFAVAGIWFVNAAFEALLSYWNTASIFSLPLGLMLLAVIAAMARLDFRPIDIALISLLVAVTWTFVSDSQPFSDFETFYQRSANWATVHSLQSLAAAKSTTTVLFFGTWMDLAGTSVAAARIGGAVALAIASFSTATMARRLGYPPFAWRFAGLALGLSAGLVAYSPVIGTELPLLASLTSGLCAFVFAWSARDPRPWAVASGLLLGLAYLTLPIAVMFCGGVFLLAIGRWVWHPSRWAKQLVLALLIGLAVCPIAQTMLNWRYNDTVSPNPYQWTAAAALQGTSIACDGGYCAQDLALAGYFDENVSHAEFDKRAWELTRQRWAADPTGLLWFSLTTKQRVLWAGHSQLVYWSLAKTNHYLEWLDSGIVETLRRTTDGYYFATMLLLLPAMFVVYRYRLLRWPEAAFAFGIAGAAPFHSLLSVQQRYHLVYVPFILLLLGLAGSRFLDRRTTVPLRGNPQGRVGDAEDLAEDGSPA
jgi:hypothetical protein